MERAKSSAAGGVTSRPRQIYISYAREDAEQARQMADELGRAGFEPWLDVQKVNPGENWSQATGNAIEKSDAIVLLVSKAFLRSEWTTREWNYAISSKKHAGSVLPILVPGTPIDSVPWILKHIQHLEAGPDWKRTAKRAAKLLRSPDEAI